MIPFLEISRQALAPISYLYLVEHLQDVCIHHTDVKEFWDAAYGDFDVVTQLYIIEQYHDYKMVEAKSIVEQAHEINNKSTLIKSNFLDAT